MFLHHAPFWLRAIYPNFVWRIRTNDKVLFLTFDDGPIPDVTEFVLSTLEDHAARATFFCIGDN
ncbi:MAG: polysaccharide deacetylase family protein, partial [Bacteroidetes bacterium]|nr:polysaccharide deacetylase family protein [Bacteroidota bacterium]